MICGVVLHADWIRRKSIVLFRYLYIYTFQVVKNREISELNDTDNAGPE